MSWVSCRNATARALSSRRSDSLGLIIARNFATMRSDPFFPPFIAGVESAIAPSGQLLVVRLVADQDAEIEAYQELAQTGRVDGVFVTDIRADDRRPALLAELGLPAVTLNRPTVRSSAPAVCVDDRAAVRDAMEHLVGLGHRRIGHVGGPSRYLHAAERRQVWADVLRANGLREDLWAEADFSAAGGAAATRQLLDPGGSPDSDSLRQRPDGGGRILGRTSARSAHPGRPVGRRASTMVNSPNIFRLHWPPCARTRTAGGRPPQPRCRPMSMAKTCKTSTFPPPNSSDANPPDPLPSTTTDGQQPTAEPTRHHERPAPARLAHHLALTIGRPPPTASPPATC